MIFAFILGLCNLNPLPSSGNYYYNAPKDCIISDCFFWLTKVYNGYGSIGYFSISSCNLSVYSCVFYNCSVDSGDGGVFYYSCIGSGSFVLQMVCAYNCYAEHYHFAQATVNQYNSINLNLSTICSCSPVSRGYFCMYMTNGQQIVSSSNFSKDNAYQYSTICIYYPFSFEGMYNTIVDNYVENSICFYITGGQSSRCLNYSSFIRNNSPYNKYGVLHIWSTSFSASDCIFYQNLNILFYVAQSTLILSNSFIDTFNCQTSSGTVHQTSNSITQKYPNDFTHFQTFLCKANVPFISKTISPTTMLGKDSILHLALFIVFLS